VNPPHLFAKEIAVAGMMGEVEIESESRKAIFRVLFGASCEKRCSNQEYSYEVCSIHSFFYFLRLKFYFQVFVSPLGDTKSECEICAFRFGHVRRLIEIFDDGIRFRCLIAIGNANVQTQ